jgi:hypothetical protein
MTSHAWQTFDAVQPSPDNQEQALRRCRSVFSPDDYHQGLVGWQVLGSTKSIGHPCMVTVGSRAVGSWQSWHFP